MILLEEPALLIQGPRAIGKTTLLERIGQQYGRPVIDFSDDVVREIAAEDVRGYLDRRPRPVLIDEYQHLPAILGGVKYAVDHERSYGMFVLTGSTTADLLPRGTDSLAGRLHDVTLWGFSQGEILAQEEHFIDVAFTEPERIRTNPHTPETRSDYAGVVVRGGFPEAVQRDNESARTRFLLGYAARVVERDLPGIVDLRRPAVLRQVLHSSMLRTGQVLNVSDITNDLGVTRETVNRYLDLLERVFLIDRLPAFSRDRVSRLARHPKIHATDTGLAAAIAGFDRRALEDSTYFGHLLESFVVGELRKQSGWAQHDVRLSHFREHNSAEVDIVIEAGRNRVVGIEVKSSRGVTRRDLHGLQRLAELTGPDFVHGFVLYTGSAGIQLGDDPRFSAVPVSALWRTQHT